MKEDDILDEMRLPLTNPKEELENISKNKLLPLFNVENFEVRHEEHRDKGIDIFLELKKAGKFTNFRTSVQLKATETIMKNKDGSISLQIHTSNINYLLNDGNASYYVLYFKEEDKFYYENLNDFVHVLNEKDENWATQGTHTLRFSKVLDQSSVDLIYDQTHARGLLNRKINKELSLRLALEEKGDSIHIGKDLDVYSDKELHDLIVKGGRYLLNDQKWKTIIEIHELSSTGAIHSPKYNLFVGISFYYSGRFLESLTSLKRAKQQISDLSDLDQELLIFIELNIKHQMGLIDHNDYFNQVKSLQKTPEIKVYGRIETAKLEFENSINDGKIDSMRSFINELETIIRESKKTPTANRVAKAELIQFKGYDINSDILKSISMINAFEEENGPMIDLRVATAKRFLRSNEEWQKEVNKLLKESKENNDHFTFYLAKFNEIKVMFEQIVYTTMVKVEIEIPGYEIEKPDDEKQLRKLLGSLELVGEYFKSIDHFENQCATLQLKYEILHYLKDYDKATAVVEELKGLIELFDLPDYSEKLKFLLNKGTTHENLQGLLERTVYKRKEENDEIKSLVKSMENMDAEENNHKYAIKERVVIELYPIGAFQVPISRIKEMFEIVGVQNPELIDGIKGMFEAGIVPVLNILRHPILKEGYGNGIHDSQGLKSWKNIHRIRKTFFELKFFRNL